MPANRELKRNKASKSQRVKDMADKALDRLDKDFEAKVQAAKERDIKESLDSQYQASAKRYDEKLKDVKMSQGQQADITKSANVTNVHDTEVSESEVREMAKLKQDLLNDVEPTVTENTEAGSDEIGNVRVDKVDLNVTTPKIDGDVNPEMTGDEEVGFDDEETEEKPIEGNDKEKKKEDKQKVTNQNLRDVILTSKSKNKELMEHAKDVVSILTNNIFVKQFFTNNSFSNGFAMKAHKDAVGENAPKDAAVSYEAEYVVEKLKPGRPKSVVVSVPEVIATFLKTAGTDVGANIESFADLFERDENGNIDKNGSWRNNWVDLDMNFNDFMTRVTTLLGGVVLEYGGADGELSYDGEKYNCKQIRGDASKLDTDKVAIEPTYTMVNGKKYMQYEVSTSYDPGEYIETIKTGKPLTEKVNNARWRWINGQVPLVRSGKAFSQLLTPKNFTPLAKYDEVAPFVATLSKEDAVRLSARAKYWYDEKLSKDKDKYYLQSYSQDMFKNGSNIAEVFNPDVAPDKRFQMLTHAENVTIKEKNGETRTVKVIKKDESGNTVKDSNGKTVYEYKPVTTGDRYLTKRIPRDHFTGKQITAENMGDVKFVRYGEPGMTQKNVITAPKARVFKYKDPQSTSDDAANVVGTFDISDPIFANAKTLMSEEVILSAITRSKEVGGSAAAKKRNRVGRVENVLLSMNAILEVKQPENNEKKKDKNKK